jgi:thiosulfate dehydrogenase (quinone) large subunit
MRLFKPRDSYIIEDPPIARFLFGDVRMAWLWLVLRVWLGLKWWEAGYHKVTDPRWMEGGEALKGFWERAVVIPEQGRPAIAYDWYRVFLQSLLEGGHYTWFAKLVVFGEMAIGIALILGALTGIAAFFGVFMNWHFVMAGTASTNAMLAMTGLFLILAWKTAGWWGLDRWILPGLGTPWRPGATFRTRPAQSVGKNPSTT